MIFKIPPGHSDDLVLYGISMTVDLILLLLLFFQKNRKSEHRLMILLVLGFILWGTAETLFITLASDFYANYAGRIVFFAPYWIPYIVLILSLHLTEFYRDTKFVYKVLLIIPPILFSLQTFSDYVVTNFELNPILLARENRYGEFYPLFDAYVFSYFIFIFYALYFGIKKVRDIYLKSQLKLFAIGVALSFIVGVTTNLILPVYLHDHRFGFIGPFGTVIFLTIIVLSIVKYDFFHITVKIRRVLVYSLSVLTVLVVSMIILQFKEGFITATGITSDTYYILLIFIVALFYFPVQEQIYKVINYILINDEIGIFERLNFKEYLKRNPKGLRIFSEVAILDLGYKFKTDNCYVLLWDEGSSLYKQYCKAKKKFTLSSSDPIIQALEVFKRHFHIETIATNPSLFGIDENIVRECKKRMQQIQVNFAIPLLSFNHIVGVVLVDYHNGSDSMPDYSISRMADELVQRLSLEFWKTNK